MCFYTKNIITTSVNSNMVAILVIMEDVFLPKSRNQEKTCIEGRNPCYNGRCVSTVYKVSCNSDYMVAILVIMEDVFLLFIKFLVIVIIWSQSLL